MNKNQDFFFPRHVYIVIRLTNKIKADFVSKDQTERTADVLKVLFLIVILCPYKLFKVNHTVLLSTMGDSTYRFGATYVGSKQMGPAEVS